MADALKRISKARSKPFQDRNEFYIRIKAESIFDQEPPVPNELALAKAVYARAINREDIAMITVQNHDIGTAIDAGNEPLESAIEWVWTGVESSAFSDFADSLVAAGIIS